MQIRQLQVACDQLQDRLILRVSTQADEEYRIWLTRRFLREIWPHLAGLLGKLPEPVAPDEPLSDATSFEQPFSDENATYPLGSAPLLTSEVKFDVLSDGTFNLTFRESRERSFQLALNVELLQALCAMLRAGAEHALWNLALDYAPAAPVTTPSKSPNSRLH